MWIFLHHFTGKDVSSHLESKLKNETYSSGEMEFTVIRLLLRSYMFLPPTFVRCLCSMLFSFRVVIWTSPTPINLLQYNIYKPGILVPHITSHITVFITWHTFSAAASSINGASLVISSTNLSFLGCDTSLL